MNNTQEHIELTVILPTPEGGFGPCPTVMTEEELIRFLRIPGISNATNYGNVFAALLRPWNTKPRVGAVGKHGSIAVTERVIKTLKYEWLRCVPIIKGFDHLTLLCTEFESWYNVRRPHMTLGVLPPDDLFYNRKPETPSRKAKTVPSNIERHVFAEIRLTAYRLKAAA
ncbi:MAG: integrase core domain-containing protein [Planctomycetes bacterium]|jgi:hypothetical protein|nr:integrase core domain-containing protein [Planctomycetota bacterium]